MYKNIENMKIFHTDIDVKIDTMNKARTSFFFI